MGVEVDLKGVTKSVRIKSWVVVVFFKGGVWTSQSKGRKLVKSEPVQPLFRY